MRFLPVSPGGCRACIKMCDKAWFRREIKQIQKGKPQEVLQEYSLAVFLNFKKYTDSLQFSTVFCYLSYGTEVDTAAIIRYLYEKGKNMFVPVISGTDMFTARWTPGLPMQENMFGIAEPKTPDIYTGKIDLAVIPGLAFDKNHQRLGHGGGYYDRWLAGRDALNIGLCFSWQIFDALPVENTDIPMNAVISDRGVI